MALRANANRRGSARARERETRGLGLVVARHFSLSLDLLSPLSHTLRFLFLSPFSPLSFSLSLSPSLAQGTYAKVKYGRHVETGEEVAVKIMRKDRVLGPESTTTTTTAKNDGGDNGNHDAASAAGPSPSQVSASRSRLTREIAILRRLRHPNLVVLRDVLASKDKVYVVMEFVAGGAKLANKQAARPAAPQAPPDPPDDITVAELSLAWVKSIKAARGEGFKKSSTYTASLSAVRALRPVAAVPARQFGPRQLLEVREMFAAGRVIRRNKKGEVVVDKPRTRRYVNDTMQRIVALFSWAAVREMVPGDKPAALR